MAITAFLSRSPGLLNWGPGGPGSLGHVPHFSIFSPTGLISNWLTSYLHLGYIIVRRPPSSCERHTSHSIPPVHGQGYILIFLDRMHLLFTQVHFLFWQLGRGQYVTISGSLEYYFKFIFFLLIWWTVVLTHCSVYRGRILGPVNRSYAGVRLLCKEKVQHLVLGTSVLNSTMWQCACINQWGRPK